MLYNAAKDLVTYIITFLAIDTYWS